MWVSPRLPGFSKGSWVGLCGFWWVCGCCVGGDPGPCEEREEVQFVAKMLCHVRNLKKYDSLPLPVHHSHKSFFFAGTNRRST